MNEITEIETAILQHLLISDKYFSKVFSHLDENLFRDPNNLIIFETIKDIAKKYGEKPGIREVGISIKQNPNIKQNLKETSIFRYKEIIKTPEIKNKDFLIEKTQEWIKEIRLFDSILTSADIIKNKGDISSIPFLIENSLKVNFESSIGLEYNETINQRLEYYRNKETYTPTGIKELDKELGGGIRPASLFLLAASSHGGKTMLKSAITGNFLLEKENVLFITLEMPENEIAKRIDANLLGVTIDELSTLDKSEITKKWNSIEDKIGELIIKEYGAGTFSTLDLKALLDDLKSKKGFIPDAIIIDYLGLMTSHRAGTQAKSYEMLGKVAEDLHAISKMTTDSKGNLGIKMISSSQLNRSSYGNADAGMESVSESLKIMMTADVAINIIVTDQLREQNQQIFKIVKNRYTGKLSNIMVETDFSRVYYESFDETASETSLIKTEIKNDNDLDFGKLNF